MNVPRTTLTAALAAFAVVVMPALAGPASAATSHRLTTATVTDASNDMTPAHLDLVRATVTSDPSHVVVTLTTRGNVADHADRTYGATLMTARGGTFAVARTTTGTRFLANDAAGIPLKCRATTTSRATRNSVTFRVPRRCLETPKMVQAAGFAAQAGTAHQEPQVDHTKFTGFARVA